MSKLTPRFLLRNWPSMLLSDRERPNLRTTLSNALKNSKQALGYLSLIRKQEQRAVVAALHCKPVQRAAMGEGVASNSNGVALQVA